MLGEINTSIAIIEKLTVWLNKYLAKEKQERKRNDVAILINSGKLLVALRALDNELYQAFGRLLLFELSWSSERRQRLTDTIAAIALREQYISTLRASANNLAQLRQQLQDDDSAIVLDIYERACAFLRALGNSDVTPFPDRASLRDFVHRIETAETEADAGRIRNISEQVLDRLARGWLSNAEMAFQKLAARIKTRHGLDDLPDWQAG